MISLFEKTDQDGLSAITERNEAVFSSLEAFQRELSDAEAKHAFDQLILVGGGSDIAWLHASIPAETASHVAAEIQYPLIPAWFKEPRLPQLTRALKTVLTHE